MNWLKTLPVLAAALAAAIHVQASETKTKTYELGSKVEAFTLKDVHGKEHDLGTVLGEKVVVLNFWNCQCPVSRAYEERYKALASTYKDKEVAFYAIDSNTPNDEELIKKYAKEHELNYPVLKDWKNKMADKFQAKVTPHVYVIGKDQKIHYIGAIDNNQNEANADEKYLEAAIEALLNNREIAVKETKAFGCAIKRG